MKKLLVTASIIALALLSFTGCNKKAETKSGEVVSRQTSNRTIKVGYAQVGHESVWRTANSSSFKTTMTPANGYDLIYIDGAQVKKSLWQPGMIKGHITPTIFSGNYDLSWIDATMEPIGDDAYATIENGVLLTLVFPEYKSQVRFAKATVKR